MEDDYPNFYLENHVNYFLSCLKGLPEPYTFLETSRLTAIYFSVVALDMLGELERVDKDAVVNYMLAMLVSSNDDGKLVCGFVGSSYLGHSFGSCEGCDALHEHLQGHLAQTFSALATLYTLGEPMDKLPKEAIVRQLSRLQGADGGFGATENGCECDLRFLYCACAVSAFLNDWGGVDKDKAASYVLQCLSYDGGLGLAPGGSEGQGGATYCGVASLALMDKLDSFGPQNLQRLQMWMLQRVQEEGGYNGRVNKVPDSCYSFWVGGAAHILGSFGDTDREPCRSFLLYCCQNANIGGFSKTPGDYPDILHSFYSIAWLSMHQTQAQGEEGLEVLLKPFNPLLGVCERS